MRLGSSPVAASITASTRQTNAKAREAGTAQPKPWPASRRVTANHSSPMAGSIPGPPPPGLSRCWWTGQALDHRPGGHAGQHAQEPDSDRAGEAAHRTVPYLRTVADLLRRPP